MKRALILHGFFDNSRMYWFQKEKKLLEKHGYLVTAPDLPHSFIPRKGSWLRVVDEFAPDKESVLLGFSLGGTTILKYLETTETKVDTVILLATPIGFTEKPKGLHLFVESLLTDFLFKLSGYEKSYDWDKIKESADRFILIYKNGDPKVCPTQGRILAENLGTKLIMLRGKDHMHKLNLELVNKNLGIEV